MSKFLSIILIFIFLLTSGCVFNEDPRSMASTEIQISYDGEQCQPFESFIPLGENIELTLINDSEKNLEWYLIFQPFTGEFEDQDPENILAFASSPANQSTTTEFKAPYLPGKYSSFCVADYDFENLALTYILVVEPYK